MTEPLGEIVGTAGAADTVTDKELGVPLPQEFFGVTCIVPEEAAEKFTVMLLVVLLPVAPVGNDHV